jgi:hypothetical protein
MTREKPKGPTDRWSFHKLLDRIALKDRHIDRDAALQARTHALLAAIALARAALEHEDVGRVLSMDTGREDLVLESLRSAKPDLTEAVRLLSEPVEQFMETVRHVRALVRRSKPEELEPELLALLGRRRDALELDRGLITLMARLLVRAPGGPLLDLDHRGDVLFDPACRDGQLVVLSALDLSKLEERPVTVEARETSQEHVALATVLAFALGIDARVHWPHSSADTMTYARVVATILPAAPRTEGPSDWDQIRRALSRLTPGGRAVLLLARRSPLFARSDIATEGRREILSQNMLRTVIELPSVAWSRALHTRGALLVLETQASEETPAKVTFVRTVPREDEESVGTPFDADSIEQLVRAAMTGIASEGVAVAQVEVSELADDTSLEPAHWIKLDEPPGIEQAMTALQAAERAELEAAGAATRALQRYLAK